ncbi:MAG TPA: lycopene cyclase domain-containing protein [Methylomirabilota bacterium]|nr:lycopene cyclase domain-containing protein [Methylomirabilota bacterium]
MQRLGRLVLFLDYHYSYLIGALLFDAAWVACFIFGKSYRLQILWGTLISAPLALTSILFIPQYWTPPSLFNFDQRFRVGIEDILWAATVGGIASAIGEIFLKERLAVRRRQPRKRHYFPFAILVAVFLVLEFSRPNKTIYNTIIAFAACALIVAILRNDLILTMLVGALDFTVLYFALFVYFLLLYPDFIQRFYNVPNPLGIYVWKVPIEELLFAASGGAVWSVAYEYVMGYRFAQNQEFRLAQN